ncbi:glycosyltransferase involved in cell wall biosynthesis [Paenibacillus sp. BK033]|nr:glycosyltransferase involved in cell wall biosynthesis [Paenibacillus sp. BK033]
MIGAKKMGNMADITAIILTKNEEINIRDCILSIKKVCKRIVVIDSFSTDRTIEIAESLGAEVYQNKFINYAKQYIYGVEVANIQTVWTLRIDADERLTTESAAELASIADMNMNTDINGIVLRFKKNFLGRDLYHGGVYPWKKMNAYKTRYGSIEDRSMDEHIVLSQGKVVHMKKDSLHYDFKNIEYWINKHNWYSSRETVDYFDNLNESKSKTDLDLKTWFKMKFYYKLPMGVRARLYYVYRYYVRLGFLDGKEGQIYAFLQAYWYRYLVDVKIFECEKMETRYEGVGELK